MPAVLPRVLMITGRADSGGGPEHVFQLSRQLQSTCEVFIAAPNEHPYWDRYLELLGAGRVFEIPHRRFSRSALHQLIAWCQLNQIDVIHSHGRAAGSYSRFIPRNKSRVCVHTPHGSMQVKSAKDLAYWFAEFLLTRRTDHTIAVSQSEAGHLRKRLWLKAGLTVIPNGVPIPATIAQAPTGALNPLRVVHVTRFVPQKNSPMVLDILEQLRRENVIDKFHIDLLGDGPGCAALEQDALARGLSRHLTFHGAQPSVDYYLSQGFCLLTTSRWEGLPLAVLEALAKGLPVIASDTAGNNDVVSSAVGRLFQLNDPSAAAAHLIELASNPDLWRQLSGSAVELIRTKYSAQRMGRDTFFLYERLLNSAEISSRNVAA